MTLANNFKNGYFFDDNDSPFDVAELIAEDKIREAMERGDFDNLSCKGKPVEVDQYLYVPKEKRMGMKVLKNAGFLPAEMELRKEAYLLEKQLEACKDDRKRYELQKELNRISTKYRMMMEKP